MSRQRSGTPSRRSAPGNELGSAARPWPRVPGRYRHAIQYSTIIQPLLWTRLHGGPGRWSTGWMTLERNKVNASELHTDAKRNRCPETARPGAPMNGWRTPTKRSSAPMNSSRSMSEQLAKIEGDDPAPSCGRTCPAIAARASCRAAAHAGITCASTPTASDRRQSRRSRSPMALLLAAGFVVTALVLSAYGGGIVTRWAPQLGSTRSSPPEDPTLAAQSAPSIVQVAAAETAPLPATSEAASPAEQRHRKQHPWLRPRPRRRMPRHLPSRRQQLQRQPPRRLPIKPSCCKRSRAISRRWSRTSNSSRRTSSKWPATIQKPLASSRPARKK